MCHTKIAHGMVWFLHYYLGLWKRVSVRERECEFPMSGVNVLIIPCKFTYSPISSVKKKELKRQNVRNIDEIKSCIYLMCKVFIWIDKCTSTHFGHKLIIQTIRCIVVVRKSVCFKIDENDF